MAPLAARRSLYLLRCSYRDLTEHKRTHSSLVPLLVLPERSRARARVEC